MTALLCSVAPGVIALIAVGTAILGLVIGFAVGYIIHKRKCVIYE
jgi:hypothetical protein